MFWKTSQNSQINTRSSHPRLFCQTMFLKKLQNLGSIFAWSCRLESWNCQKQPSEMLCNKAFIKILPSWHLCWRFLLLGNATFLKKTSTQMLSCETFKNSYFEKHLRKTTSNLYLKRDSNTVVFLWILWIIQEHLFCRESTNSWSETPARGLSLNKVASLTTWRPLTVSERDSGTGIFLWF